MEWEYAQIQTNRPLATMDELNAMGAEGWELVGVTTWSPNGIVMFFFKRPLSKGDPV